MTAQRPHPHEPVAHEPPFHGEAAGHGIGTFEGQESSPPMTAFALGESGLDLSRTNAPSHGGFGGSQLQLCWRESRFPSAGRLGQREERPWGADRRGFRCCTGPDWLWWGRGDRGRTAEERTRSISSDHPGGLLTPRGPPGTPVSMTEMAVTQGGLAEARNLGWPSETMQVPLPQRILDALRGVPHHHQLPVPGRHHGTLPALGTHAPAREPWLNPSTTAAPHAWRGDVRGSCLPQGGRGWPQSQVDPCKGSGYQRSMGGHSQRQRRPAGRPLTKPSAWAEIGCCC